MFWKREKDSPKLLERIADLEVNVRALERMHSDLEAQVLKWRRLATRELREPEVSKTAPAPSDFDSWPRLKKKAWLRGRINGSGGAPPTLEG